MATWVTRDYARDVWQDAPLDDALLDDYLAVAQSQCEAFAPALAETDPVPVAYRLACVTQARNIYSAVLGNQDRGVDESGLALTTFPLDWSVQQMLRPKRRGPGLIA